MRHFCWIYGDVGYLQNSVIKSFAFFQRACFSSSESITTAPSAFVSLILLSPLFFFILKKLNLIGKTPDQAIIHSIGGVMASSVMLGAVFFHLATPLGIVVLHNGQSDHGSLFFAAVSILILGITMALVNFTYWRSLKSAS